MKSYFKGEHYVSPEFLRPSAIVGACLVLSINDRFKNNKPVIRQDRGLLAFGVSFKLTRDIVMQFFTARTHVECDIPWKAMLDSYQPISIHALM